MTATVKTPKARGRRKATTVPTLPPLFVLLASHGLTVSGSSFQSFERELSQALVLVAPMLTPAAMLRRDDELSGAAWRYADRHESDRLKKGVRELLAKPPKDIVEAMEAALEIRAIGIWSALPIGLVAGYLLAQLVAEKDGAR